MQKKINYFDKNFFNKTFLIAEIGVNHDGKIAKAIKLIEEAKKSGADAVKFQTFKAEKLSKYNTPKTNYQIKFTNKSETHFDMLKKLELSKDDFVNIKKFAEKKKIIFISTPYDCDSAEFLNKINTKIYKISSADLTDCFLNETIAKFNKPTIISTGMSNYHEISRTVSIYKNNKNLALLHCVSNYPCSLKALNLKCIQEMSKKFKIPIGFSDHTKNINTGSISVAAGAKIIEKHFTLNPGDRGPDHHCSLSPKEFKKYSLLIRDSEKMLGNKNKYIQNEEKNMKKISRKSLCYINSFQKNEKLNKFNFINLRPGTGIDSFQFKKLLNKKLKKNVNKYQQVKLSDFFINKK